MSLTVKLHFSQNHTPVRSQQGPDVRATSLLPELTSFVNKTRPVFAVIHDRSLNKLNLWHCRDVGESTA